MEESESSQSPSPETPTTGTVETVPLAGDDTSWIDPPEDLRPAEDSPAPVSTAMLIVHLTNVGGGAYFGFSSLTAEERTKLVAKLAPVLKKYHTPDLIPPEEAQLLDVVAEVYIPRIMLKLEAARLQRSMGTVTGPTPRRASGFDVLGSSPKA